MNHLLMHPISAEVSREIRCYQEFWSTLSGWPDYGADEELKPYFIRKTELTAYDCTGHVDGSCLGTDISITPANFNHQKCKLRCIYQVLKFPNQSPNSVIVEFASFRGYLQLDHPVTCEKKSNVTHIFK